MSYQIIQGNCLESLRRLPSESVQCCVTSPPYWGLRKYSGEQDYVWGGDPACSHAFGETLPDHHPGQVEQTKWKSADGAGHGQTSGSGSLCLLCGAWRGGLGLEPTPELYISHLVEVFREVKRILKKTGVLWCNIGDSYAGSGKGPTGKTGVGNQEKRQGFHSPKRVEVPDCKPKDLIGVPWMLAFALRADGWYLRSDIIWEKTNCMPESVTDRPTKSHEYVFLLAKSGDYFYDKDAILEPLVSKPTAGKKGHRGTEAYQIASGEGSSGQAQLFTRKADASGRNRRSVWSIPTKPYKGAHFACFPPDLVRPCVLAGSRVGDTVLDPFCGSGTTLAVALEHGRAGLGLEASHDYIKLAEERISAVLPSSQQDNIPEIAASPWAVSAANQSLAEEWVD